MMPRKPLPAGTEVLRAEEKPAADVAQGKKPSKVIKPASKKEKQQ
jgi:hypothetical protein